MLKVDNFRKHVYEYTGVEGSRLPDRCIEIADPSPFFRKGYSYYHLDVSFEFEGKRVKVLDVLQDLPHGGIIDD